MRCKKDGKKRIIGKYIVILAGFAFLCAAEGKGSCRNVTAADSSAARALADGNYAVDVVLTGGSGKASVESPTLLIAEEGRYFARITWSSPNYDYMVVDGETYYNQNTDGGNSRFQIPVLAFDEEMPVIADTVAMGAPHEIAFLFGFGGQREQSASGGSQTCIDHGGRYHYSRRDFELLYQQEKKKGLPGSR